MVRQDLRLVVRERDAEERRCFAGLSRERLLRAHGAGGAMVPIRDIEHRHSSECVNDCARRRSSGTCQIVCRIPSGAVKSTSGVSDVIREASSSSAGDAGYVRNTGPVCARSSTM